MQTASHVKATPTPTQSQLTKSRQPVLSAPTVDQLEPLANDAQAENQARVAHSFGAIGVLPPIPPSQPTPGIGASILNPFSQPLIQRKPAAVSVTPLARTLLQRQPTPANQTEDEKVDEEPTIQTKLEVGKPADAYEQEAERDADQVKRMPSGEQLEEEDR